MTTNIITIIAVLISALLTIFILNSMVNLKLKNKLSENENPITINLFKAILFLCGGIVLNEISQSFNTVTNVLPALFSDNKLVLNEISYCSIFYGIGLISLLLIFWSASLMFTIISGGKSVFLEVTNNNLNAVLLFAGLIFAILIAVKPLLLPIFDQLIPYPNIPTYR
ncbi:MAG: hypothetical protein R2730_10455 [Chitinophagales bacterium]